MLLSCAAAVARQQPTYDLTLLLDPNAPDEQREKVLADVEKSVGQHGEVVSKHDWGLRPMAYEIDKSGQALYHLIQFHGTRELLEHLNRTLRITDGVTRFRIIKLDPGTPDPPDLRNQLREEAPTAPPESVSIISPVPAT